MSDFQTRLNQAAAGEDNGIVIFWDNSDPENEGPAYRDGAESGPLEFAAWDDPGDITETTAYQLSDYFGYNCNYRGVDCHGVHPLFSC